MNRSLEVYIYTDYPSESLNTEVIIDGLERLGIRAHCRGNLFQFLDYGDDQLRRIAGLLAASKITNIEASLEEIRKPYPEEPHSELRKIKGLESVRGEFYDGFWIQRVLYTSLAGKLSGEMGAGFLHMIFTGRLIGTFDIRRYHARVVLAGNPSLISTSGLVEGPARPKEYYFIKGGLALSGREMTGLDLMYKGKIVEYDDPRTSSVLCSYALQAVNYEVTGNEFCRDPDCCLYNSHWQEEVLKTQYEGKLCGKCIKAFAEIEV
ncbi:MAG: DUF6775 family putative metallopeptidase [Thermodesulfobacteriota bacterium]